MTRRKSAMIPSKLLQQPGQLDETAENARFQAKVDSMADVIYSCIHQTAQQGINAALAMILKEEPGLEVKARNLADQMVIRSIHLNREIHRFLTDSRSA